MFTQKVILDFDQKVESLFVRRKGNELSFDTFFNSLNLYLIKHYTDGKTLTINLDYVGDAHVKITHSVDANRIVLFESNNLQKTIRIDLTQLPEKGIVYPVFAGDFKLKSLTYEVDATSRKISTGIAVTTYNRQQFLFPNLYKLDACENIDKIIVVDNAKNISLPKELNREKFLVVPSDNLGGSGGFTRGILTAKKLGLSHVFLMDDDIILLPEVIDKALSFISCLKKEHEKDWLGFSIFTFDTPIIQLELGARWNGKRLISNNKNYDLGHYKDLVKNQINNDYHYSGWWSLVMPTSIVDDYGYPLPFFIKFDDVEYGLRRKDEEIILTNGFGVWHEDFNKKAANNASIKYYLNRNIFVSNAIHDKKAFSHAVILYFEKFVKYYLRGKYTQIKLTNLAVDDYLKGPDFFIESNTEVKNNEIRKISSQKTNFFKGLFCYPFICIYYCFKLLFKYNNAKREYLNKFDYLTSEQYWSGVFNDE